MTDKIELSIVIVNFETPSYTLDCIGSIYANSPRCSFEIILIDNGSKDGSIDRIRERWPKVVCIETGANLGFARANNLGINNTRGEYVLLLNSDTKILDNSLDRLLGYLRQNPKAGVVGPKQIDGTGKLQLSWGSFPTFVSEMYRKLLHHRLSVNDWLVRDYLEEKFGSATEVDWVSGSCLLARREALFDSGLLDEHYFMYFEDIDLCRRISDAGWGIHYEPDTTILHYGGISAKKNILKILVEYRRSQLYFTRKYYGLNGILLLKSLLIIKSLANLGRYAVIYLASSVMARHESRQIHYANLLLNKKTLELALGGESANRAESERNLP